MPKEVNELNIPAYQRKRSLAAKARKKTKRTYKRKTTKKPRTTTRTRYNEPEIEELPLTATIEEAESFPNPIDIFKPTTKRSTPGVREMKLCGRCDGYFDNINVAVVQVTSPIRQGDILVFEKVKGLFEQEIDSMQINRKDVSLARSGSDIGLKVAMKPKVGTPVYKVI